MDYLANLIDRFWQPILNFLPKLPPVILSLIVGYLIIQLITWLLTRVLKFSKLPKALISVIMSLSLIVMWVALVAELARQLGLNGLAVTISGSLAVIALALATGASSLTSDIISGVFLARDSDFEIGYKIRVGSVEGIIHNVDIRKIRVIDKDGTVHIFPNNKLDKEGWDVVSREIEDNKVDAKKMLDKK
ncbi:MAG: small-conductance mechanosensitive channel [Candidatus Berkelbacteria bacterium Athens1014_28]|uniref:Small-conductance mechanosensitive channel n=1 Tax=Candidatus Berkelbacteria bacterium Athens1014_28 TaxID=2017145 RepID=A0A554LMG6_9BACT|nr:MAG: small-conductance mechanosensitive channel [Candidatus Berkelbacteria bacterium Athens1014_28]